MKSFAAEGHFHTGRPQLEHEGECPWFHGHSSLGEAAKETVKKETVKNTSTRDREMCW